MITLTRGEAQNVLNLLILWLDEQEEPDTETAIETLRTKLSEPEPEQLDEIVPADEEQLKRIAKLVAPEPEPVAWMYEFGTDNADAVNEIRWYKNVHLTKPTGMVRNVTPLYTAPPQRDEASAKAAEWVGLTDEETNALIQRWAGELVFEVTQALREKNI